MKHLSRFDIEAIADKYVQAYMALPDVRNTQIYKVTMTTGVIELKCPNCHRVVEVDLSLRKGTVKYRLTRSSNRANN